MIFSSVPMRERLRAKPRRSEVISVTFLKGRLIVCLIEFSSIPKKVKEKAGPSAFSGAKGIPCSAITCKKKLTNAWQWPVLAEPIKRKLSM